MSVSWQWHEAWGLHIWIHHNIDVIGVLLSDGLGIANAIELNKSGDNRCGNECFKQL